LAYLLIDSEVDTAMGEIVISSILVLLIGLVIESRVQIAYIKGKLEVLERKFDNNTKRRNADGY